MTSPLLFPTWRSRHYACVVASVMALAACGGEPRAPAAAGSSASATTTTATTTTTTVATTPAATPAPAAVTGKTHEVRMIADEKGYRFDPASLSIRAGDAVRWVMISGGPHNVSFWPDSVPAGAAAMLGGAMTKQLSPLAGPLLMQPNEGYTISFAGAPAGTYRYFCTPHLLMGMKATLTVQ